MVRISVNPRKSTPSKQPRITNPSKVHEEYLHRSNQVKPSRVNQSNSQEVRSNPLVSVIKQSVPSVQVIQQLRSHQAVIRSRRRECRESRPSRNKRATRWPVTAEERMDDSAIMEMCNQRPMNQCKEIAGGLRRKQKKE
ncbi:hypothetical protein B9Z55_011043 [Caenorhabditis nigoni]|uniref:Uncharacterized protein n=1 Tax=Caenorhabditis nigoni TaxID=1611254 RepID=A0A2G5UJC3_9PELO|nr:hypothetical protein B9Z55_011043 [Caenorhabditis nigoni]